MPQVQKPLCLIHFWVSPFFSFSPLWGNKKWAPNIKMRKLEIFCTKIIPPTWSLYWGVQFLITPERGREEAAGAENGKRDSSKSEWYTGVSGPGAFKLDHLQPVKLILYQNYSTYLIFILGSPIPYHPRAENEKRDSLSSEWETGVSVPGASKLDHLQPDELILFRNFSIMLIFILGGPIDSNSYYPRERL